ncbi:hypothetical protein EVAR_13584_1 [Eumeta japonica]|uniref:Uncharacterized protein n=1 Tax=Eumeta variegata TaxID=151549 RepID=A0A4C1U8N7_EUMVA|nr:hypothetical protein EVAR_13584_1 [Eumeta japonica]
MTERNKFRYIEGSQEAESRTKTGTKIKKVERVMVIRIKSLIGIEIHNMKELFVPGFIQVGTVNNSGIGIKNGTLNRIGNGTRIRIENGTGTKIENGTVMNESWVVIKIKSIALESKVRPGLKLTAIHTR